MPNSHNAASNVTLTLVPGEVDLALLRTDLRGVRSVFA